VSASASELKVAPAIKVRVDRPRNNPDALTFIVTPYVHIEKLTLGK
jgi:hypothetical protein